MRVYCVGVLMRSVFPDAPSLVHERSNCRLIVPIKVAFSCANLTLCSEWFVGPFPPFGSYGFHRRADYLIARLRAFGASAHLGLLACAIVVTPCLCGQIPLFILLPKLQFMQST